MSITIVKYKKMIEAKAFINKVIKRRISEGYEYPRSLAQCKKLIFKFNQKMLNPKTNLEIDSYYIEWLVPKITNNNNNTDNIEGNFKELVLLHDISLSQKETTLEPVTDEAPYDPMVRKCLVDYLCKLGKLQYLELCVEVFRKVNNKPLEPQMHLKTDFISCINEYQEVNETIYDNSHELMYRECDVHYETDQLLTESIFERIALICFGKQINKVGCEYILLWQHCYKRLFTLIADEADEIEQQSNSDKVKPSAKVNRKKTISSKLIKDKMLKQPYMNKLKIRNDKYKQLANMMKNYITTQEVDGKSVHNFNSPCPLQCTECIYSVNEEVFHFYYTYYKKKFMVQLDPITGLNIIQHYSRKIVELMD
jgi:hypothetical protein